jgi:hypothetical protein
MSKVHSWVKECINKVEEEETKFVHQCIICGIVVNDPTNNEQECTTFIFARYCGYCDENVPLDELKFHSIDEQTQKLFCDLRENEKDQYKEYMEEKLIKRQ